MCRRPHDDPVTSVKLPCARCGTETFGGDDAFARVGRHRYCPTCGRIRHLEAMVRRLWAALGALILILALLLFR